MPSRLADADRLRRAADGVRHALYVFEAVRDASGVIEDFVLVEMNTAAEERVGRERSSIVGTRYSEMYPPANELGLITAFASVVETGVTYDGELFVASHPKVHGWVRLRATKLDDGIVVTSEDMTDTRALRERADVDALTRVLNRGAIMAFAEAALATGVPVGLLMIDADYFKRVNDTYGHAGGDEVLRAVSARLVGSVRPTDVVGRYGGEEFLVVLPSCTDAWIIAERIRESVAADPVPFALARIPVTVSIGATVSTTGQHSLAAVLAAADGALYRAKKLGRNRTEYRPLHVSVAPPSKGAA